jgi:ORF6N domain
MSDLIPEERIESKIFLIRGQKVMLDRDLARLYGVKTHVFNQAVKRNIDRFPEDFMFQLTKAEFENLTFQSGISNLKSQFVISRWGGRRTLPYAFTEQGVAMLSSVLKSKRAVHVNIAIMRAFVKLRQILSTHKEVSRKLKELEQRIEGHDKGIKSIFDAIRKLMEPERKTKGKIRFVVD